MRTVCVETLLPCPPERAFDLAIDLDEHVRSAAATGERVIARTGTGPLHLGDEVTFEARHLGLRWRLSARIVLHDRPNVFVDEATRGPFRSMRHEHLFEAVERGTRMTDLLTFSAPLPWLTEAIIARHLERFLIARAEHLRRAA